MHSNDCFDRFYLSGCLPRISWESEIHVNYKTGTFHSINSICTQNKIQTEWNDEREKWKVCEKQPPSHISETCFKSYHFNFSKSCLPFQRTVNKKRFSFFPFAFFSFVPFLVRPNLAKPKPKTVPIRTGFEWQVYWSNNSGKSNNTVTAPCHWKKRQSASQKGKQAGRHLCDTIDKECFVVIGFLRKRGKWERPEKKNGNKIEEKKIWILLIINYV